MRARRLSHSALDSRRLRLLLFFALFRLDRALRLRLRSQSELSESEELESDELKDEVPEGDVDLELELGELEDSERELEGSCPLFLPDNFPQPQRRTGSSISGEFLSLLGSLGSEFSLGVLLWPLLFLLGLPFAINFIP